MTSHVLLEGILDVKDPRGSEDRKFWKAWRRQWVSFSVIYPSGRREPHLLLKLSHCSSETPVRQIRIQREGLRIFRCRSKSRPYRTWTIMSGNKLVLYFAAESEVEAQDWMKDLRDGLWPTCFSFQMLTACTYEVSLIDDENTFLSGLLGVYGRFVLTSDDVISLMHPHWGSTLLQISLSSIHDVLFVREAEIQPAGVFNIVLKRDEESKVKTLQFFCSRAMDAIQWILSKMYSKSEKINENPKINFPVESPILGSDGIACFGSSSTDLEFRNSDSINQNPSFSNEKNDDSHIDMVYSNTHYENLQFLKFNSLFNSENCNISSPLDSTECSAQNDQNNQTGFKEHVSEKHTKPIDSSFTHVEEENEENQYLVMKSSNPKLYENFYINFENGMDLTTAKSQNYSNYNSNDIITSTDSSTITNRLPSSEVTGAEVKIAEVNDTSSPELYSTMNSELYSTINKLKVASNGSRKGIEEEKCLTNELSNMESFINNHSESKHLKLGDAVQSAKSDNKESTSYVTASANNLTEREIPAYCNINFSPKESVLTSHSLYYSNSPALQPVQKQTSSHNKSETTNDVQFSANSFSSGKFLKEENNQLLLDIPSDILNTSFNNTIKCKSKTISVGSSSYEDNEILPWVLDEFVNSDISEGVYEDILDRRGTVYEEIDSSESDSECTVQQPPSLPERPQNLIIPDSLRLQMLSKKIEQTLEISNRPLTPTKKHPRPKLIKKIKEISRVMQISPTQESSREPFIVETKLPVHVAANIYALKPNVNSTLIKTHTMQNKCGTISTTKNVS